MTKKTGVLLGVILLAVSACSAEMGGMVYTAGELAGDLSGLRVAVFNEEGFPSKSPRGADWYEKVLTGAGMEVTPATAAELSDISFLANDRFDAVLIATGGYFPVDSEEAVGSFLAAGGTVVIDGNMMVSEWSPPDEIAGRRRRLESAYNAGELRGEALHEYRDFQYKHGLINEPKLFRYSEELGRWVPKVERFYYSSMGGRLQAGGAFGEFELQPWPNHVSSMTTFRRPFDADLERNPVLAEAGLMEGMPELLRTEVPVDKAGTKVAASSARADGFIRFLMASVRGVETPEYVNNLLIPLYIFGSVSGRAYGNFVDAGRDEKDRESDFYIMRYNTALKRGGTLLHFGVAGAHLLKSVDGAEVLIAALRLSESKLPGEREQEFIDAFHRLDASLREYQGITIELMDNMDKLSRCLLYAGEGERLRELTGNLGRKREEFDEISSQGERLYRLAGERADRATHGERLSLTGRIDELSGENRRLSEQYSETLAGMSNPPAEAAAENYFGRLTYGFSHINPAGLTRLRGLYPLIEKLGFSIGPYYHLNLDGAEKMQGEHGISSGYRLSFPASRHFAKRGYESGILDPETGNVSAVRPWTGGGWFETEEDWKHYEEDVSWFLKKADASPGISYVVNLSERNFGWSMWGERMLLRFRDYVEKKHGDIAALNAVWGSNFGGFEEIVLPVNRPETRQEHALWEDWTRYREIYYVEEEVRPEYEIIKRHAPRMWMHGYGSYHRIGDLPANGINFYDIFKLYNPSTFEMGSRGDPLSRKIIASDIAGFHNRNLTSEWGAFYFPPPSPGEQIDRLKEEVWKGVTWGQVGIQTYMGSRAGRYDANFINMDNVVMPLGWAMKSIVDEFKLFQHIVLDGEREEPRVRVLYSPTTRRHRSWPGGERDMPMEEIKGYYTALNSIHIPVRAIDEGAVMEGYLPAECRLLILPRTEYMNDDLLEKVLEFVEAGGSVLINPETGRYNEYGHRNDSLLSLAGVSASAAADRRVALDRREFDAGEADAPVSALRVLFPDDTEVVLRYRDGEAALTRTGYGSGSILVSGIPFGDAYMNHWQRSPDGAHAFLRVAVAAGGVVTEYIISDMEITARPWEHGGRKYLMLHNPARTGMVRAEEGPFPFVRAPRMTPFEMHIRGNVRLVDYVLGVEVPGEFDGEHTKFSGLIPSPGGVVYEVGRGR